MTNATTAAPRGAAAAARLAALLAGGAVGFPRAVAAHAAPLRRAPADDAALDSEALRGEVVSVFEEAEGWALARLEADGYLGFLPAGALGPLGPAPTHRVRAARAHLYPAPSVKAPPLGAAPLGARLVVGGGEGAFARLAGPGPAAFVPLVHLAALAEPEPDHAAVAERLLGAPYLWGGRTLMGIDCSGLVGLALGAAGAPCPRDSDQLEALVGRPLATGEAPARGDLAFWRGHVGVLLDGATLLHANAHHMAVAAEPLAIAAARIEAAGGGPVTSLRRPRQDRPR